MHTGSGKVNLAVGNDSKAMDVKTRPSGLTANEIYPLSCISTPVTYASRTTIMMVLDKLRWVPELHSYQNMESETLEESLNATHGSRPNAGQIQSSVKVRISEDCLTKLSDRST